jgi:hypothetical protein
MNTLNSQLKDFNKDIKKRINRYKINLAKFILWFLIKSTPVDTSTALSNWIVGLGKQRDRKIEAHKVGVDGSTQDISAGIAMSLGGAIIQRAKVGEIVYITNNVDYIELLNMGYSVQAERHYIERCVSDAIEQMKREKL